MIDYLKHWAMFAADGMREGQNHCGHWAVFADLVFHRS